MMAIVHEAKSLPDRLKPALEPNLADVAQNEWQSKDIVYIFVLNTFFSVGILFMLVVVLMAG